MKSRVVDPIANAGNTTSAQFTHFWRIRKWHPERHGQPCRVLARGALNTVLIEFQDGQRMTTSRWFIRRIDRRMDE